MKTFLLIFFATQWAYAAPFVPMTEAETKELRHILNVIKEASAEQGEKLRAAEKVAADSIAQLRAATDALVQVGNEAQRLQNALDSMANERDAALMDAAAQAKWKRIWLFSFVVLVMMNVIYVLAKIKS